MEMNSHQQLLTVIRLLIFLILFCITKNCSSQNKGQKVYQKKLCMPMDETIRARRKTCLLRPDTGPCRADLLQWYYDAKQRKCFRFFWGGCQGNGNRFESQDACLEYCFLNSSVPTSLKTENLIRFDTSSALLSDCESLLSFPENTQEMRPIDPLGVVFPGADAEDGGLDLQVHVPYYCSLTFDFGTCFGQYHRWAWDSLSKTCRRRLYSGCGGNQNNFETQSECLMNCLTKPNNSMSRFHQYTTCIPFTISDLQ